MASSISGSSSQSTNEGANQSTVSGAGSITITVGSFSGQQSWGRVNIGDTYYDIAGPTAMSQGQTWNWDAARTYTHTANGERGDVGVSVSFRIDGSGNQFHANSTGAATQGALNYDRKPATAGAVTATVNVDKTITVNVGNTASLASSPTFKFSYSTDGGSTWSAVTDGSTSLVSGTTYTGQKVYTGLTPGYTYIFRAYATNSDGQGAPTTASGVFLMSGGKRWNGTAWVPLTTLKRWNGTAWVNITTAKRWNGSAWVNLQ